MDRRTVTTICHSDAADHPAVAAWQRASGWRGTPAHVVALKAQTKPSHKSGVYRLVGVEFDGVSIRSLIAKRALRDTAELERRVRRQVLSRLSLPTLREYAFFPEEETGYCWTFLEDAGDGRCSAEHALLAARWLGTLHREAAALDLSSLPDRGAAHYLDHLQEGRARLVQGLRTHALSADDRQMLERLTQRCDTLMERWDQLERRVAEVPPTLAHGDFVSKNLRVREVGGGVATLFALDWETAGRAPPVADLSENVLRLADATRDSAIDCYRDAVGGAWPGASRQDVERAAQVGLLFRLLASIRWAGESLCHQWVERPINKLRAYEQRLGVEFGRLGWESQ